MPTLFQTTSIVAVLTVLATAPIAGMAQDVTTDENAAATVTNPDAGEAANMDAPSDAGAIIVDGPVTEEPIKPVEGQIVLQSEDTILANNLIGSTVYTTAGDETVGSISDLLINLDGTVDGVVIGVGGFLGMGKKLVAIKMDSIDVTIDPDGSARLTSGATKADLKAAETFVTAKEQENAAAAEQLDPGVSGDAGMGVVGGTGAGTGTATAPAQ